VRKSNSFPQIAVAACIMGFVMTPVLPVSLELGCENSYPIGEATPSGLLISSGQLVGIFLTILMQWMISNNLVVPSIWLVLCLFGIAGFSILFIKEDLKRLNHEKKHDTVDKMDGVQLPYVVKILS